MAFDNIYVSVPWHDRCLPRVGNFPPPIQAPIHIPHCRRRRCQIFYYYIYLHFQPRINRPEEASLKIVSVQYNP